MDKASTQKNQNQAQLNERQQRFLDLLLTFPERPAVDLAIEAGYARKSAKVTTSNFMRSPKVAALVKAAREKLPALAANRIEITAEKVIQELGKLAFTDLPGIIDVRHGRMTMADFENLNPAQRACIKKVKIKTQGYTEGRGENAVEKFVDTVEYELWPKIQALELLGDHLGLWSKDRDKGARGLVLNLNLAGRPEKSITVEAKEVEGKR